MLARATADGDGSFVSRMAAKGAGQSMSDYLVDIPDNPRKRGVLLLKRLNMKKESIWICREFSLCDDVLYYSKIGQKKALDSIKLAEIDHLQLHLNKDESASKRHPQHGRRRTMFSQFGAKSVRPSSVSISRKKKFLFLA